MGVIGRKFFAAVLVLALIWWNAFFPVLVYSQEITPSPSPETELISEPTPEPSPVLFTEPSPSPEIIIEPAAESTDSAEPTIEPTPSPSPSQADEQKDEPESSSTPESNQETNQENKDQAPEPEPTPSPEPVAPTIINEGIVETIVTEQVACRIDSLNGCLITDKPDYTPSEIAIIIGHGFTSNSDYRLHISSADEPAVEFTGDITTDETGSFKASYQLDGNYRPNYFVEVKDTNGVVVAATSFTDSRTIISATLNGGGSVTVNPNNFVSATVTADLTADAFGVEWHSTSYEITTNPVSTNFTCVDTADYDSVGTHQNDLTLTAPAAVGTYNVFFRISGNDCSNQGSATSSPIQLTDGIIVVADTTDPVCPEPTITSTTPAGKHINGSTFYYSTLISTDGNFTVTEAASDIGSGIQSVTFPATVAVGATDTSTPYSQIYNWVSGSSFHNSAAITCTDNAGNSDTTVLNVLRDNTYPQLNSVSLDDYSVQSGTTVNITANVIEEGSGVGYCHAFWSGNSTTNLVGDIDLGDLGSDCDGPFTIPSGSIGTAYVKVRVGDNVGIYPDPMASNPIIVDDVVPSTSDDTVPGGPTYLGSTTVTLTPTDNPGGSGIANTKYCIENAGNVCVPNLDYSAPIVVTCPGVASCSKWLFYQSTDNAGNVEVFGTHSYSFNIVNDVTAPTTTDDIDGSWHNTDVTVNLSCTDNPGGTGCAATYYTTDGTDPTTGSASGNSFTLSAEGTYTVKYFSVDSVGNSEAVVTAANQVKIDKTDPTGNITNPTDGVYLKGVSTIAATASDESGSGIDKVEFSYNPPVPTFIDQDSSSPYLVSWNTNGVAEGLHRLYIRVFDLAGNVTDYMPQSLVTVDNTAPTSPGIPTTPTPTNNTSPTWDWIASTDSNFDHYIFYWDIVPGGTFNWFIVPTNSFTHSSPLALGIWYAFSQAYDAAGNASGLSLNGSVSIDTSPPSDPVITAGPAEGSISGNNFQDFEFTIDGDSTAQCHLGPSELPFADCDFNNAQSYVGLGDATYTFSLKAIDPAGNESATVTRSFTIDTAAPAAPTIGVVSHNLVTWNSDRTIDISWDANDPSGIAGYSFAWNLNPSTNVNTTIDSTNNFDTSPARASGQSHYFHVRAVDNAGNWSTTTDYGPFWIDAVNPLVSWDFPTDGAYLAGGGSQLVFSVNANDTDSGIDFVRFRYQPSGGVFTTIDTDNVSPYQASFDTGTVSDGSYILRARAQDFSTRVTNADITVTIDNTSPDTPSANPVGDDYTADQNVTLTSNDATSGLAAIYYTTDGTNPSNGNGATYTGVPILIDKDTTLKAIAYDNAGNTSGIMTETYGIAPVISGETTVSTTATTIAITWTTDDPATSRVIYDTVSHDPATSTGDVPFDKYSYAFTTDEFDTVPTVTDHYVSLSGLSSSTTYYYRTISHGSPETVSAENSFTTNPAGTGTTTTGDGGGTGGTTAGPAACTAEKPGSAPSLTGASAGANSATLTWSEAAGPVSYYLVAFGLTPSSLTYGNPNVGGAGTTSYTVTNLSGGTTYYFRVRAGNGCTPGDYSNEIAVTPSGGTVSGLPGGFAEGVLGATTQEGETIPEFFGSPLPTEEILGETQKNSAIPWWWWLSVPVIIGLWMTAKAFKR